MGNIKERADNLVKGLLARSPLLYIQGMGVEPDGQATIEVQSPADGQTVGRAAAANAKDVARAVESCQTAFHGGWSQTPAAERAGILWRAAELVDHYSKDLAVLETLQTGKTYREALTHDVAKSVAALRYFAGLADKRPGEAHDLGRGLFGFHRRQPHEVIGVISAWSFPLLSAVHKVGAALAAGSTVVLKPSELTPLSPFRLAEILSKAGLPPGVFNVVTGFGQPAGEALAAHPTLRHLCLDGTIETARRVLVDSAKSNLKQVQLSLGGKSANIVFEDANLKRAIGSAWRAVFTQRGQVATAGARLLVHDAVYEEVVGVVTARARQLVLGDPLDEHTEMGPVISEAQLKRILSYVELGRREGGRLVAGGSRDSEGAKAGGFFVKPTVFMDVTKEMRIAQEDIFGPVLSIMKFRNEEEALEIANATDYAMAAAVWTQDLARAHRVADQLDAGIVWINHYDYLSPGLAAGGRNLSGSGADLGLGALDPYSQAKTIYLPTA